MRRMTMMLMGFLVLAGMSFSADETPILAKTPPLSRTAVTFEFGGYLWSVPRGGVGREQLSTLTIPSQGPIVDPGLGTITKAPEEQEDKTVISFFDDYIGRFRFSEITAWF